MEEHFKNINDALDYITNEEIYDSIEFIRYELDQIRKGIYEA